MIRSIPGGPSRLTSWLLPALLAAGSVSAQVPQHVLDQWAGSRSRYRDFYMVLGGLEAERALELDPLERRVLGGVGEGMQEAGYFDGDLVLLEPRDQLPAGTLTPSGQRLRQVYEGLVDPVQALRLDPDWSYDQTLAGDLRSALANPSLYRGHPDIGATVEQTIRQHLLEGHLDDTRRLTPERIGRALVESGPGGSDGRIWFVGNTYERGRANLDWLDDYATRRPAGDDTWREGFDLPFSRERLDMAEPLLMQSPVYRGRAGGPGGPDPDRAGSRPDSPAGAGFGAPPMGPPSEAAAPLAGLPLQDSALRAD